MYRPKQVRYIIPINDADTGETFTVDIVTIYGSDSGRCSRMTKYLKHKFDLTRKEAHRAIVGLGFDDLIPNEAPCVN